MALAIFYDGKCPICARYLQMVRLSDLHDVSLIDVRLSPTDWRRLETEGFDVDQGMVVDFDGQKYGGADAVNILSLLSTPSGYLNRINKLLLGNRRVARLLYPCLRAGRWTLLFVLGRPMLHDAPEKLARQAIVTILFALFSIVQIFQTASAWQPAAPNWASLAILASAVACLFHPQSSRLFALLMASSAVGALLQPPAPPHSVIVPNALLLGYWLSFAATALRNRPKSSLFQTFAVLGGCILLAQYLWGIFYKINADGLFQPAIFGIVLAEAIIMLSLILPRWRDIGVIAGIGLTLLLALQAPHPPIVAATLAMALHALFLSENAAQRILSSKLLRPIRLSRLTSKIFAAALIVALALGYCAVGRD